VILTSGRSEPRSATVHHKQPHKGDLTLFYDTENLEAVYWSFYSGAIQSAEALGYDIQANQDGWPIDPANSSVS